MNKPKRFRSIKDRPTGKVFRCGAGMTMIVFRDFTIVIHDRRIEADSLLSGNERRN
jgi:hypothetical protein